MKVRVLERFVAKGRIVRYPGEVIDISREMAEKLVRRRIAKPVGNPPQEFGSGAWMRKKPMGGCGGCPKRG